MNFKITNGVLKGYYALNHAPEITVPDNVTEIADYAISRSHELHKIIIPDSVQKISYHAFYGCFNLKCIQVDENNPFFADDDGVLYDRNKQTLLFCPNGREAIHLPKSVTWIQEKDAFAGCLHLKNITVDQHNPKYRTLNGVLYEYEGNIPIKLVHCPVNAHEVNIPESVQAIYPYAFESCTRLKEITLPEQITEVKTSAFRYCKALEYVRLPDQLHAVRFASFAGCESLKEMTIPHGAEIIEDGAFLGCRNLEKLFIPESVRHIGYSIPDCVNLHSVICHGINVPIQNVYSADPLLRLIVNHTLDNKIPPLLKYTILSEMLLKQPEDQKIMNYIQRNFTEIMTVLIQHNQSEAVQCYVRFFPDLLNAQNLDEFIQLAINEKKYEIQVFLTDLKYQRNDFSQKDWSL